MSNPKIYAVTPNPALDLSGHVPRILPDEKNYVTRTRLNPGGNSINAARIARRLGAKPVLTGFLGGESGRHLRTLLKREKLLDRFIKISGDTRINVTATNDSDGRQTRLTFPGPMIRAPERARLIRQIRGFKSPGILLLGGSLPGGCSPRFYSDLLKTAHQANLGCAVDVPSPVLRGLLHMQKSKLLFMKPNRLELEILTGKKLKNFAGTVSAARQMLKHCALLAVSLGQDGLLLAWRDNVWHLRSPRVRARGSVGAGDSMVGAIAYSLTRSRCTTVAELETADEKIVLAAARLGVAAGAATVSTEGTELGSAKRIRELTHKVKVHRIL